MNTTFDQVLDVVRARLEAHPGIAQALGPALLNRDLAGRVRLIVPENAREALEALDGFDSFCKDVVGGLGPHADPGGLLLFESDVDSVIFGAPTFGLAGFERIRVVDRLATVGDWGHIADAWAESMRVVFYSIKGGVGRSTALAVLAGVLAERGHRVMVVDLDLASPGLSSGLLPSDRHPTHGVVDWLVEDLVDNGDTILDGMVGTVDLPAGGEVIVVPAHGTEPGEYISKLGRVWMPKVLAAGRESWSTRLRRMLGALEARWKADIVLIDSRSGIDEISSACVTEVGASLVLIFANDSAQAWDGYEVLFEHWRKAGAIQDIRKRLQVVGAAQPVENEGAYQAALIQRAATVFSDNLYDEIDGENELGNEFNFGPNDELAPHYPWRVRWDKAFMGLKAWRDVFGAVDGVVAEAAFGPLIEGIARWREVGMEMDDA